jgi:hypothetical protein
MKKSKINLQLTIRILICGSGLFLSGCLGLPHTKSDVVFPNPYIYLNIVTVPANAIEKTGIHLRLKPSPAKVVKSKEETVLYAKIENKKGLQLKFNMESKETYKASSRKDSFVLLTETDIEGQKGKLVEEKELTDRGEIVKYLKGFHNSEIGKFKIKKETSTPKFPEGLVRVGSSWAYEEKMDVEMHSLWVKEVDPKPFEMKVSNTLEGYALVKGARCAVIRSHLAQTRREHLKFLFKEIIFDIESQIDETSFFDYKAGILRAKITQNQSHTVGINIPVNDVGQSQSIYYLVS